MLTCRCAPTRSDTRFDPDELTAVAVAVAEEAARHVRARRPEVFGVGVSNDSVPQAVSTKSTDTDPVTIVDTESETLIRELLADPASR